MLSKLAQTRDLFVQIFVHCCPCTTFWRWPAQASGFVRCCEQIVWQLLYQRDLVKVVYRCSSMPTNNTIWATSKSDVVLYSDNGMLLGCAAAQAQVAPSLSIHVCGAAFWSPTIETCTCLPSRPTTPRKSVLIRRTRMTRIVNQNCVCAWNPNYRTVCAPCVLSCVEEARFICSPFVPNTSNSHFDWKQSESREGFLQRTTCTYKYFKQYKHQ